MVEWVEGVLLRAPPGHMNIEERKKAYHQNRAAGCVFSPSRENVTMLRERWVKGHLMTCQRPINLM